MSSQHIDSLRDVTALLLVRVRFEPGSAHPLRADMRSTSDVSAGFEERATVTDVDTAVAMFRDWLTLAEARAMEA